MEVVRKIKASDIVLQCKRHLGEKYVYGTKGEILTLEKYNRLKKMYGDMVWDSDKNKIGQICNDCSGLITTVIKELISTKGRQSFAYNSTMWKNNATKVVPITSKNKKDIPVGAMLWMQGHIGWYIGNGRYIAQDGSARNCCERPLKDNGWTHYLLYENLIDYTFGEHTELYKAVHKIIDNGIELTPSAWEDVDNINLKNLNALLDRLGGVEKLIRLHVINDRKLWRQNLDKVTKQNVASLIIKYANTVLK